MPATGTPAAGWDCHVHVFDAAAPVRPGHYVPAHRPLAMIEQLAGGHGVGHLVLVQPSVYGTHNDVMLQALQASAGRHRGVAVVDAGVADEELDRLHAAGVRGVRFNLVSPAGHAGDPWADLQPLAPRLIRRGWHVQWYVHADALPRLVRWQGDTGLVFVLDHLAGLHAALPADAPAWAALHELAAGGAWIKLSGWYRLGAQAPYDGLHASVQRVAAAFGRRTVWGSDWPHTGLAAGSEPAYDVLLEPVRRVLGDAGLRAVLQDHAAVLYGGGPGGRA